MERKKHGAFQVQRSKVFVTGTFKKFGHLDPVGQGIIYHEALLYTYFSQIYLLSFILTDFQGETSKVNWHFVNIIT